MFYENKFPTKIAKTKSIRFDNFSKIFNCDSEIYGGMVKPRLSYNFISDDKSLISGFGISDIKLSKDESSFVTDRTLVNSYNVKFLGAWLYNYYSETFKKFQKKVVLYGEDKNIYFFRLFGLDTGIYQLYDETLNSIPDAIHYNINGKDIMIFSSKDDKILVWHSDSDPYTLENVPMFRSICMHSSRLFAIVEGPGNKIWYSDNADPTSWPATIDSTIGVIEFPDEQRGKPNKILSFLEDMYVFRDFGISKITYYPKTQTHEITQLFISSGNIFSDTVCICNDKIYMLASDGIYVFDGNETVKLDLVVNKYFSLVNSNAKGAFFEGKYFVACNLNYDDNTRVFDEDREDCINNTLISVDVLTNQVSILRGVDIAWLLPLTEGHFSKLLVCLNGDYGTRICELTKDGLYFDDVLPKHFEIDIDDLGNLNNKKIIKKIYIDTLYDCVLKIRCDGKEETHLIKGGKTNNHINIMKRADKFSMIIESNSQNNKIKTLEVLYDLV